MSKCNVCIKCLALEVLKILLKLVDRVCNNNEVTSIAQKNSQVHCSATPIYKMEL